MVIVGDTDRMEDKDEREVHSRNGATPHWLSDSNPNSDYPELTGLEKTALRFLSEKNSIPVWAYDLETRRFIYANPAAESCYGYSLNELYAMTIFELFSPEEHAHLTRYLASASPSKSGSTGYWHLQTKEGKGIWAEIIGQKIVMGTRTARLINALDVTERVRGWEEHRATIEALEASERKEKASTANLAMILEEMSDAFITLDREGHLTAMNRRAEILLRQERAVLLGKNFWSEYPRVVGTLFQENCHKVLTSGESVCFEHYSTSQSLWLEVNIYPLWSDVSEWTAQKPVAAHAVDGLSIFLRDITTRKEAAAEAERIARERTEEAVQLRHFLKEVLFSVTEGKLRLCDRTDELPAPPGALQEGSVLLTSAAALGEVRQQVREAVVVCDFAIERGYDLMTASSEAAMNGLQHGSREDWPARASVFVAPDHSEIQVWVSDRGKGIQLRELPRATLLRGHSTRGTLGHGFYLMLQTMDEIYLMTGSEGTTIVLRQFREPAELDWVTASFMVESAESHIVSEMI